MENAKIKLTMIIIIVLMSFSIDLKSQDFEGRIIYKTSVVKPENSNIPDEEFNMMFNDMDTISVLYLKNNRYKLVSLDAKTNKPKTINLYDPELNKSYGYMAGQREMGMVSKVKTDYLTIPEIYLDLNDTIIIIGKKCHSITIEYGSISKTKVYFSEDYKVNIESIKNSPYGFLEYIYRTGSLPLKIISTGNGAVHNTVFTAIEIKKRLKS